LTTNDHLRTQWNPGCQGHPPSTHKGIDIHGCFRDRTAIGRVTQHRGDAPAALGNDQSLSTIGIHLDRNRAELPFLSAWVVRVAAQIRAYLPARRQNQDILHQRDRFILRVASVVGRPCGQHQIDAITGLQHARKCVDLIDRNRDGPRSCAQPLGKMGCIGTGNGNRQQRLPGAHGHRKR
jgi:hypothetical protein